MIGAMTKIQAKAYITAYSTLEEHVSSHRASYDHATAWSGLSDGTSSSRGRRSAWRIGGGAVLCPGIEIDEEAFVGVGAVVTRDVAPR